MNLPNFKNILEKLSVFKSNLSLLAAIIVGLVSVILFVPTEILSSKLKAKIADDSISIGKDVNDLRKSAVSRQQWKEDVKRHQDYANDANEIALLAELSTRRELLIDEIFPKPKDTSTLIFKRFGQQYRKVLNELMIRVNARDCPTEAELNRGLESSSGVQRMRGGGPLRGPLMEPSRGPSRVPSRIPGMDPYDLYRGGGRYDMVGGLRRTIIDEICQDRAQSCSVYVTPADLAGYEFWADYKLAVDPNEAIGDCWYYQLGYWVIEDIFDTIDAINSASNSVFTSPVKRLVSLTFTMGLKRPGTSTVFTGRRGRGSGGTKKDEADKPNYVFSFDDGLTESCTGRFSNDDIDVIHFNVAFVVGAKEVLPFMQQLCSAKQHIIRDFGQVASDLGRKPRDTEYSKHNQITILETKMRSVEPNVPTHRLYRYGEDSVVELELICEYIFNKKGYDDIKPEPVKKTLKLKAEEKKKA